MSHNPESITARAYVARHFDDKYRICTYFIMLFVDRDCQVTVIDLNQDGVRRAELLGFRGAVGDATQSEVLEHAQVAQSKAVVITVPHHHSAMMILEQVRQLAPHAHVVVRSRYQMHTNDYVTAGAHTVVGDDEQVGESLSHHLRQWHDANEEGEHDGLDSEST